MQLGGPRNAVSSSSGSGRSPATKDFRAFLAKKICFLQYFSDRMCVHTLQTLYVYATASVTQTVKKLVETRARSGNKDNRDRFVGCNFIEFCFLAV